MDILDSSLDTNIRAALADAESKDKLEVVAAVTGLAGGADELRKIMHSTDELSIIDRGTLGLHLNL